MSIPTPEPQQFPKSSSEGSLQCQGCRTSAAGVSYCNVCGLSLCDNCWDSQLVHRPGFLRPGATPHTKVDPWIAQHINNIFSQPQDASTLEELHTKDEKSAWFGIERYNDRNQPLLFRDHGKYADLMAKSSSIYKRLSTTSSSSSSFSDPTERSPSLVSFVGQTGAGKSTTIKLLIESNSNGLAIPDSSPVIGMVGKNVPTSEDVHLYLDPSSALTQTPLLYADCEGLDGGEREPVASRIRSERNQRAQNDTPGLPRGQHYAERQIQWAKSRTHRTRHFAVSSFYPRILFTFSDVVVFVHRNSRVIEPVLEKLIEWAETALETSSNQPILPCAVLAINASEHIVESEAWDPAKSTKALLDSLAATVDQNVAFVRYAELWRARGRKIASVEELFLCYFSSFKVVHIPNNTQPGLLLDQIRKLHTEILKGSQTVRERKISLRMLLNSQELQSYLQDAFDHFSRSIEVPFDFVQTAFANRNIPASFGGNILELAVAMMKRQLRSDARAIFDKLSFFVSSCIMLDAVRNAIKGTADHILPHYIEHLDAALEGFCDNHWPCEFAARGVISPHLDTHRSDMWLQRGILHRCVNVQSGHGAKGHQMQDGHIFAFGSYEAKFSFSTYRDEFHTAVYSRLRRLLERLAELEAYGETQESAALLIHREDILKFFFIGNSEDQAKPLLKSKVCLSCLFHPPEHVLSCGHVLCTACARGYGQSRGKNTIQILECPLDDVSMKPCRPRIVHLKPNSAGVRILALDDGGIRASLQLEILRLIESEFDGRLSIQHLFDLVVGHGTGSIIALHLTNDRWTSRSCSIHLEKILRGSYDRSQIKKLPTILRTYGFFPGYKYHSKGLQTALKTALTDSRTLFDTPDGKGAALKAAIVADTAGKPVVFTNYRYSTSSKLDYCVHWPDDPVGELKTWEVARASMSNRMYFKPYKHPDSDQTFNQTDFHQQNIFVIARGEQKRVFPSQPSTYPDLLLSLGSGFESERRDSVQQLPTTKQNKKGKDEHERAHNSWYDFLFSLPASAPLDKFVRIDPSMSNVPELDDLDSMDMLRDSAKSYVDKDEIRKLALRLFANLFYFEPSEHQEENTLSTIQGFILCRLPSDTIVIREVGKLLQTKKFVGAIFAVEWDGLSVQQFKIPISTIEGMIKHQIFNLPAVHLKIAGKSKPTDIMLRLPSQETYSISGFPRVFINQTQKKAKPEGSVHTRKPSWNPPTAERLALVDLGPLNSPITSNASYQSLGGRRSSNSTNCTIHSKELPNIPELNASHSPHELEAPWSSCRTPPLSPKDSQPWTPELKVPLKSKPEKILDTDKVTVLQALKDAEIEQRVAEREAARRRARRHGAGPPPTVEQPPIPQLPHTAASPSTARTLRNTLLRPPRKAAGEGKRLSESSEDEIFGQIIAPPTVRFVRY